MAITLVSRWFTKIGKGQTQVHQKDADGNLLYEKDKKDEEGNPLPQMGNEQYEAHQIPVGAFNELKQEEALKEAMSLCNGNFKAFVEAFRLGWNELEQRKAGGLDDYARTFRFLAKIHGEEVAKTIVENLKAKNGVD